MYNRTCNNNSTNLLNLKIKFYTDNDQCGQQKRESTTAATADENTKSEESFHPHLISEYEVHIKLHNYTLNLNLVTSQIRMIKLFCPIVDFLHFTDLKIGQKKSNAVNTFCFSPAPVCGIGLTNKPNELVRMEWKN